MILDLYCGTGTIAQILAKSLNAERVIGVELVPEAAEAARGNALRNGLDNCRFISGDVLGITDGIAQKPSLIVLDPPRDGVHGKALPKICGFGADHVIYVSCNPKTLARDLAVMRTHGYTAVKIKAHDMFPRTKHVECVVLLRRKDI
jgi:tRNA/tmRNA/rRNA uracil-C5-methylase (TrmA/RlmC/RlmD family)